jgi:hypothetical protein
MNHPTEQLLNECPEFKILCATLRSSLLDRDSAMNSEFPALQTRQKSNVHLHRTFDDPKMLALQQSISLGAIQSLLLRGFLDVIAWHTFNQ